MEWRTFEYTPSELDRISKAIAGGHALVTVPVLIIQMGLPYLAYVLNRALPAQLIMVIVAFIVGAAVAWAYWSAVIPFWRVWAFRYVKRPGWLRLRNKAIKYKLIWPTGSPFERTEFRSPIQKRFCTYVDREVAELQQIETINLDLATPQRLSYRLDRWDIVIELAGKVLFAGAALLGFWDKSWWLTLILIVGVSLVGNGHRYIKYLFRDDEILIIDHRGIRYLLPKVIYLPWDSVFRIKFNRDDRALSIHSSDGDILTVTQLDISRLYLPDLELFSRQLQIMYDRYTTGGYE